MDEHGQNFGNHLLIALPSLRDSFFERSVTLICQHDSDGAMGVMVNRPSDYTVGEVLQQMGIASDDQALQAQVVLAGGPVHPERGFVLHDGGRTWDSSLDVGGGLFLTTSRDVLEAMARGEGPGQALVALGCAGWGIGQLEQELVDDSWLLVPSRADVLFDLPLAQRWQAAAGSIGVDLLNHASHSGHA
ncbi:YqgE/AlgH family protein [Thermomonas paludicola]|uniref:YqgE/AlgH family protein n=1 Tax=Thermomonas paludicola TaxID=2884874 RepID=UPI002113E335|nr:YqgE/AlgH family protein [Thermomonas paludicola]